jgi:hypothetical protein
MAATCIAKLLNAPYFSEIDGRKLCQGQMLVLPGFWMTASDGNLDAHICEVHARIALETLPHTSYLSEQLRRVR